VAVGSYNIGPALTLIESWDGTSWNIVPSPSPGTEALLSKVSCTSASSCYAVGVSIDEYGVDRTLIESWDGMTWKIVPSPNPGMQAQLSGVSCTSASSCMAVGYSSNGNTLIEMLAPSPGGAVWRTVPSPNPGSTANALTGVSCISASSCTAVGSYLNGPDSNDSVTLVETWDGKSWIVVPSPNPSDTQPNFLYRVSCVSAGWCVAVGNYYYPNLNFPRTLIESWDGMTWKIVSSPNPGSYQDYLFGVSCVSASSCKAAGFFSNGTFNLTLMESWDGVSWSVQPSPNPGLP
jgi:hypothetical protein